MIGVCTKSCGVSTTTTSTTTTTTTTTAATTTTIPVRNIEIRLDKIVFYTTKIWRYIIIQAYCPPDGVWGEWSVTGEIQNKVTSVLHHWSHSCANEKKRPSVGACASSCGSYNVAARKRNCTDKCGKNCPCTWVVSVTLALQYRSYWLM